MEDLMKTIAILGATSHIAKGLIYNFNKKKEQYSLQLFARNIEKTKSFCDAKKIEKVFINKIESFNDNSYDVIINCIGVGTPNKLKELSGGIFALTEKYDDICIDNLKKNPDSLYINLSSGAIFGDFDKPISATTKIVIDINNLSCTDFYALAKINSEAKHRALDHLNIVDLRVFAYFSRFIELDGKYLMTEIINSIKQNACFKTTNIDIVRDYIDHEDFFNLIECCILQKLINDVFDVYSANPISKFELLKELSKKFGLLYEIDDNISFVNATGIKNCYFSEYRKAFSIGYEPIYSSIDCIEKEMGIILTSSSNRVKY